MYNVQFGSKVFFFVSAIPERETSVDGDEEEREELERQKQLLHQELEHQQQLHQKLQHQQLLLHQHPEQPELELEPELEEDSVFICGDTHVILRINGCQEMSSQNAIRENACSETNEKDQSLVREATLVEAEGGRSKIYSKRMTKRLITAAQMVMIYENIFKWG